MKIVDCEQGSPEWFAARAGIVTASELNKLITPLMEPRKGEGVDTYLNTKIAERLNGGPLVSYGGGAMEQGSILEGAAIPSFTLLTGFDVRRFGFVTTDAGDFGSSPDGLVGDDPSTLRPGTLYFEAGLECKCPLLQTHVGYLRNGGVPKDYLAQVHGGMYATGLPFWYFMSFNTQARKLIVEVQRDEEWIEAIGNVLAAFNERLKTEYERIMQ